MPPGEVASLEFVSDSAGFVVDHLWAIVIIVVGLGLLVLSCRIRRRSTTTDPLRDFASHEYKAGMARAGHRCEMPKLLGLMRCRQRSAHGDHFIPWSKGGASVAENFVAACAPCNLSKSAHFPSVATAVLIAWRRRRYFPPDVSRFPGKRYDGI